MFFEKLPLDNQTVLVRVDYNVPVVDGKITDPRRIDLTLKTLNYLLLKNCKVILFSHMARPKTLADQANHSLSIVSEYLNQRLDAPIKFINTSYGQVVKTAVQNLNHGEILMLENTRFNDITENQESVPSPKLAKFWASLAKYFVFEAFATAHRVHTSTFTVLDYFPKTHIGYGYLVANEMTVYQKLLRSKIKPFVVIIGGSKPLSKIPLIAKIAKWVDRVIVCGALAYPFLKIKGYQIGKNPTSNEAEKLAAQVLRKFDEKIVLPFDFQTTKSFADDHPVLKTISDLEADDMCLDCGPKSALLFKNTCQNAQMIFWNGPPGVFERQAYSKGTIKILEFLAELSNNNAEVIIGGGDSAAATYQFGFLNVGFIHVSTGGGASLVLLQKEPLPVLKTFFQLEV